MIKFVKERYSSPNGEEQETEDKEKTLKSNPNPEVNHSTVALRQLKHTQDHIDAMKRRLSVLQIREKKNMQKALDCEKKALFHARVQQQIEKDKKRKSKFLRQMEKELGKSKQKIKQYRYCHNESLKGVKEDLSQAKKQEYIKIKETSSSIGKSIEQMKKIQHERKIEKRKMVNEMEKKQREHIQQYFFNKRSSFRESSIRQGSSYESRRSERQKLLCELSLIESRMIQRQSASRAALDETYRKLYKISGNKANGKEKSTDESEKLPALSSRSHQNEQFIIL